MNRSNLDELLARWEAGLLNGQELSARDLCPEDPSLAADLQRAIDDRRGRLRPPDEGQLKTPGPVSYGDNLSAPPTAPGAKTPSPGIAATVPGYEIIEELGRGGMGVVYRARQSALGRVVALKMVLAGSHAGPAELARFRVEAEAVARLQHPSIVQVFEVGEAAGSPFLSLEYCPGGSLDKKLAGTPLDPREAAKLVEALAVAVQAAHESRVIHRDLKPGNVLLAADGTAKITDFGLAKKLDEKGQTVSGAIMGTPSYMAPEQARGSKDVGPSADIYALGALLYECLTGRPPFRAATQFDTLAMVIADDPVPPRQLNPRLPRDLDTMALKCLRKDPSARYGSGSELAEDLRRFLRGEPVRARPLGALGRGLRWVKRRPVVASLLALVVSIAALGFGLVSWMWGQEKAARQAVENHARQLEVERRAQLGLRRDLWRQAIYWDRLRQNDVFHLVNELSRQPSERERTLATAKGALGKLKADVEGFTRQRDSLRAAALKITEQDPSYSLDLSVGEGNLDDLRAAAAELQKHIRELDKVIAQEKDPRRKEWQLNFARAALLEREAELGSAIEIYEKAPAEMLTPELKSHLASLKKQWEPRGERHKRARAFIYTHWPRLTTREVKEKLKEARDSLEECKKQGDLVGAAKMLRASAAHRERMAREQRELDPKTNGEDAGPAELLSALIPELDKLIAEVSGFLQKKGSPP